MSLKTTALASLSTLLVPASAFAADYLGPADGLGKIVAELLSRESCGNLNYLPSSPDAGIDAIADGSQQTLPLSDLSRSELCERYPNSVHVQLAQQAVVVARNNRGPTRLVSDEPSTLDNCDLRMDPDDPGTFSWADDLQLLYGGLFGKGTADACSHRRRRELIENWHYLWEDYCPDGECTKLRFAFRPSDDAAATRIFKKILDIRAFCNGNHFEDNDPIGTDCSDAEDVDFCDPRKRMTLGVVQAVHLDDFDAITPRKCDQGTFSFEFASELFDELFGGRCPDGAPYFAGFLCLYPVDCEGKIGCTSDLGNVSPLDPTMDGRVYNLLRSQPENPGMPFSLNSPSGEPLAQLSTIHFNGHCSSARSIHGSGWKATIGCLVSQISCSIGFGTESQIPKNFTLFREWDYCSDRTEIEMKSAIVSMGEKGPEHPDYPLVERYHLSSGRGVPPNATNTALDCDSIQNAEEEKLCRCIFENDEVAEEWDDLLRGADLMSPPGGSSVVRCIP